jgi:hypothetical protein
VGEGASLMELRPFFLPLFTGVSAWKEYSRNAECKILHILAFIGQSELVHDTAMHTKQHNMW